MNYKVLVAAALAASVVQASSVSEKLPPPWFKNGQGGALADCQAGVDAEIVSEGRQNMTLKCDAELDGFISVMQQFAAESYRGQRLRYSALVKSDGIEGGGGGLWMRVDDTNKPTSAFDNMQNRAITGTMDWIRKDIVLDVSVEAQTISIGMLLVSGPGQLWMSDLKIEPVGADVPVTDLRKTRQPGPQNLELTQ